MPTYDTTSFEPPAPLAYVTLRNSATKASCTDIPMLLDTGADVTLIPHQAVNFLNLSATTDSQYELMGFDGTISVASVVKLELVFCKRTFQGQFLVIDQLWGILGRNVLNAVPLIFDGPDLLWAEYTRPKPIHY